MFLILMLVAGQVLVGLGEEMSLMRMMRQKVYDIMMEVYDDQDEIFLMQAILRSDALLKSLQENDVDAFLENKEAFEKFKIYMTSYCIHYELLAKYSSLSNLLTDFIEKRLIGDLFVTSFMREPNFEYINELKNALDDYKFNNNYGENQISRLKLLLNKTKYHQKIVSIINNRLDIWMRNAYNMDEERTFYKKLFLVIDDSNFYSQIQNFIKKEKEVAKNDVMELAMLIDRISNNLWM
ncbi:uncharacterized protein LOC111064509 isoform X9 [Nilaparvata lugens]|uniref:uncharacterized protein LOC111064509 isoform X9 n=1 Tax=Nilaparvata lugens TaxID=108931 RepID=UPI00193D84DB|nr:uncharacterized protein LOC111064509 isoform X9 [Nilaparvata lugens]